jgi:hypothetical protein
MYVSPYVFYLISLFTLFTYGKGKIRSRDGEGEKTFRCEKSFSALRVNLGHFSQGRLGTNPKIFCCEEVLELASDLEAVLYRSIQSVQQRKRALFFRHPCCMQTEAPVWHFLLQLRVILGFVRTVGTWHNFLCVVSAGPYRL